MEITGQDLMFVINTYSQRFNQEYSRLDALIKDVTRCDKEFVIRLQRVCI